MTVVVLGLDHREGDVRLVLQDVVGPFRPASRHHLAADNDPPLGETDFFAQLRELIPASPSQGGGDELRADVAFAQFLCSSRQGP